MPSLKEKIHLEVVIDVAMAVVLIASLWVGAGYYQRAGRMERRTDQICARIKSVERESVRLDNRRSGTNAQELSREIDMLEDKVTELNALLREE